jgi:hypothetical protein
MPSKPGDRHNRLIRRLILATALASIISALMIDSEVPGGTRALDVALWLMCLVPAYIYASTPPAVRRPVPFIPAISIVFGLYYTLPLVFGVTDQYYNAPVYPRSDYDYPVVLTFLGWIAMMAGYLAIGIILPAEKNKRHVEWQPRRVTRFGFVCLYGGLLLIAGRSFLGSLAVGGVFQFLLSLHWLGAGLLTILARRNELSSLGKRGLYIGVAAAAIVQLAAGNIAPIVMLIGVIGFAAWVARPTLKMSSIVAAVALLLVATSFRGVAIEFRREAWFGNVTLSRSEQLGLITTLLQQRVANDGLFGTVVHGVTETAGRSANLDLFANVARRTPSEIPYWGGDTYLSLVGAFIPRFLWKDKPTKELGQAFGHRYSLIHSTNMTTAINLPILVEFFAKFGGLGVVAGMLIVGFIYRLLDFLVNRPGQSALISMIAVVLLIPLLPIESDFSLIFGGLPLNGLCLYMVWRFLAPGARQRRPIRYPQYHPDSPRVTA